ncbi:Pilus assembly protein, ATPase of CpaF family [Pseudobutyrivibrio sp. NOR37]|uniref:CpaF family protein n=1 Tax=Pseudobutyrivibrio xylanivorans TaxID=185007 RepID=A0A6M0LIY7_PSEXY|nr:MULTISPECIES: ATPase, T2SS/T4P/T4SS family [Pseudobutyrivibrio]NEX02356.1 CpaF family protein [Pseudobutyrivibrio xylanivorans]SFR78462.1 Pilus assembly protein, ATPase of CpaF family [Pseudobutyrivibrio sp. NOR37]
MSELNYVKSEPKEHILKSEIYEVQSYFNDPDLMDIYKRLKANVIDINGSSIVKTVQGTEQDFLEMMNRAKRFLVQNYYGLKDDEQRKILEMFQSAVFGYYVLTPLLDAVDVSDIKVLAWNRVVCKASGNRYETNVSFLSEQDYNDWYERLQKIHRIKNNIHNAATYCTDRKCDDSYYLRIDWQNRRLVSTDDNNIHIRKIPTKKYSWDYLKEAGMVNDEMIEYFKDRINNKYGFLISGAGGSGKTSLLNKLLDWIPFNESVLISQESDELYSTVHPQMQFEHTMTLEQGQESATYSLEDELRLGLLQDIDNFVIGEIKGAEALYVFTTALNTGARFLGTIHSNDAASSVTRLAQCARYKSDYPMETLEEMLTVVPFVLVHMSHFGIREILEIEGYDYEYQRLKFRKVYKKHNG